MWKRIYALIVAVLLAGCAVASNPPVSAPQVSVPQVAAPAGGVSGYVVPQGAVGPEAAPIPEAWPEGWCFPKPYTQAEPKDGHAVEKHGESANVARRAVDPRNKCQVYQCISKMTGKPTVMRSCHIRKSEKGGYEDGDHHSFQTLYYAEGKLMEGTAYTMRTAQLEKWKKANRCQLVSMTN